MGFLTATLISTHGAGITVAAGTRFTLDKQVNLPQRLTKCQADLMQYCSWSLDASTRGRGWEVYLTKHKPDPQADQMSC